MKNKDAIEILETMAMAESTFSDEESKKCCEAIDLAVEALKRDEPSLDEALTLEQLRQKLQDEETIGPVVTVLINGVKCNGILDERSDDGICVSTGANKSWLKEKDYGKTWLAYAYIPAHIDLDAWTSEWRELHGEKMVGLNAFGDDVYRNYHYSVCASCGKGSAVKTNFCPVCGKAMTPEARAMMEKRLRG